MALFQAFDISASGMTAERFRTDVIAENVANINTTNTGDRKIVTFRRNRSHRFQTYCLIRGMHSWGTA